MTQGQATIELGPRRFVIVAQKLPRLKKRLGVIIDTLGETNVQGGNGLLDLIDAKGYDVLEALTGGPPSMPTREEWDDDELSATFPQVKAAIIAGFEVNGLDAFGALGKLIGGDMVKALLNQQIVRMIAGPSPTPSSTNAGSASGDAPSTGGTTTPPTSPRSTAGEGPKASRSRARRSSSAKATLPAGESSEDTP